MKLVTIAINRRAYTEAARNLASSVMRYGDIEWVFVTDDTSGFEDIECEIVEIESGANPFLTKLSLYEFIEPPFVYIDADSIWNPKGKSPHEVFTHESFACGLMPSVSLWDDNRIRADFDLENERILWPVQSSVMQVNVTDIEIFRKAVEVYPFIEANYKGQIPDESAIAVACAMLDVAPKAIPVYCSGIHPQSVRPSYPVWTYPGNRHSQADAMAYRIAASGAPFLKKR